MAQQRPLRQQPQRRTSESRVIPQVIMLINREVMEGFNPAFKEMLADFMGSFMFIDFCKVQQAKAKEAMDSLQPHPDWTNEEYVQLSKDMRLVWRFWTDLLRYAEENQANNRANKGN